MPKILVLYASTHGHTANIAARIGAALEQDGATVELHRVDGRSSQPAPHDYDAVVVGASIHAGHHQRDVIDWAERHHTGLAAVPSAFFSVCLTAADDTDSRARRRAGTSTSSSSGPAGLRLAARASPERSSTASTTSSRG